MKHALGKLPLPVAPVDYVADRPERLGISAPSREEPDPLCATNLPSRHRDPFDRMLVSPAIARGLALVTLDPAVRAYPCLTWRRDAGWRASDCGPKASGCLTPLRA